MSTTESLAQAVAANKQYIYVLRLVPRLHDSTAWTERDNAAVSKHFARLQDATQEGKVILAGRTEESLDKAFGIVVFEAENEESVRVSVIVDAHFSLIVDGETASRRTRRGGAQALGLNVAQSSTISLKRSPVASAIGLVFGVI